MLCLDVGSTWTKGALVSPTGELLGTAQHATTPPEVLDGIAAVSAALDAGGHEVIACSSAGGGLRLAVVGQERLVSAEAGYRVALSAGAKVVHVSAGDLDGSGVRALRAADPDLVLLVGGTDGGDTRTLLHNARRIAGNRIRCPVVLAGNVDVREEATSLLLATGRTVVIADNVLPDVGELAPDTARRAIREVFLRHVIGGKGLSRGPGFRRLVRAVTPDAVLAGVSRLAAVLAHGDGASSSGGEGGHGGGGISGGGISGDSGGAVLVVDVGGATTDVYSAVSDALDSERRHTVALPPDRRTVEGDIGMRWSAEGIVAEAEVERLLDEHELPALRGAARFRAEHVDFVPSDAGGTRVDLRLATLAVVLAVRRHLRMVDGRLGPRGAGVLVLSGGVFRHAAPAAMHAVRDALYADPVLRPVLRTARITVDRDYVLAPAGLLVDAGRQASADTLLRTRLVAATAT